MTIDTGGAYERSAAPGAARVGPQDPGDPRALPVTAVEVAQRYDVAAPRDLAQRGELARRDGVGRGRVRRPQEARPHPGGGGDGGVGEVELQVELGVREGG